MIGLEDEAQTMDKCVRMWKEILELSKTTEVDDDGDFYLGGLKERAIKNLFPKYSSRWNHDCPLCHYYKKSAVCPLAITREEYVSMQEEYECFIGCQEKYGFGSYMKPGMLEKFVKTLMKKQKEMTD